MSEVHKYSENLELRKISIVADLGFMDLNFFICFGLLKFVALLTERYFVLSDNILPCTFVAI